MEVRLSNNVLVITAIGDVTIGATALVSEYISSIMSWLGWSIHNSSQSASLGTNLVIDYWCVTMATRQSRRKVRT